MTSITLHPVTRENWRQTLILAVRPDQQRFVADYAPVALIGLAKAYVGALGLSWFPYAIDTAETMVGFVMLAFESGNEGRAWIFHFFIDAHFQGQGYGKQAMYALIETVRQSRPDCPAICLTVHPENLTAQGFYTSVGFAPTAEQAYDEPLYRLILKSDPNGSGGHSPEPITNNQ